MIPKNRWLASSSIIAVVVVIASWDRPVRASGMSDSWSGASAGVKYFDQSQANQGATATASAGGPVNQSYDGSPVGYFPRYPYTGNYEYNMITQGTVGASAGGDPAHLLQVIANQSLHGDPGMIGSPPNPVATGSVSAGWNNDQVIVNAPVGGKLPDAIRLDFTLTTSVGYAGDGMTLIASINGTKLSYSFYPGYYLGTNSFVNSPDGSFVNAMTSDYVDANTRKDSFSILLPVDSTGHGTPFNLGLQVSPNFALRSGEQVDFYGFSSNLALTGVTLADGSSLASAGDTVSFASGLASPIPAPEPASLMAWGLALATVCVTAVRRSRIARQIH